MIIVDQDVNENNDKLFHTLWVNSKTKTWTFLVTNDDKDITCVLASGTKIEVVRPKVGNPT